MPDQLDLLRRFVGILEAMGLEYMVAGSLSSGAWGEPRFTYDIDTVVELRVADVDALVARLPADEYYVSRDAALDAVRRRSQFNIIHSPSGQKIDVIVPGASRWAQTQLSRRRRVDLGGGIQAFTAHPDDVIVSKLLYYAEGRSPKHLRDIAGVVKVSGQLVDLDAVGRWAQELALAEVWSEVRKELHLWRPSE